MHSPIIGIPCRADISATYAGRHINAQNESYIEAVIQVGGIPILIPVAVRGEILDTLFNKVDGLLFTGGGDIDPLYYNEMPQVANLEFIQKIRDELEIKLMQMATERHKPFFAICRGIQVMNVANGGTLWQDLLRQKQNVARHDYHHDSSIGRDYLAHEVNLNEGSMISRIVEMDRMPVNSLHHQAVKDIAPNMQVTGTSDDGVIEVLEAIDHPFGLGVQWHPEELVRNQQAAQRLFKAFVHAANRKH